MRWIVSAVAVCVVVGCSKPLPLVGTWQTTPELSGMRGTETATFSSDGKYKSVTNFQGPNGSITATDTGTWKLDGSKVKVTLQDVQWEFTGDTARIGRAKEQFEANKAKLIATFNAEPPRTIAWKGDDSYTVTDARGKTDTYTRVKG